tara:strand:- start:2963 stop:3181 length:219 start_codon:yes stop_codon:yes gene_type:complete
MVEQETLFDMTPDENTGGLEQTEIEYLQLAFSDDKKKEIIIMMESIIKQTDYDVYADLLFNLVRDRFEKNNS